VSNQLNAGTPVIQPGLHPAQAQKALAFPLKIYDKQKFLAREAQGISCI
jgi:hypothetical protein